MLLHFGIAIIWYDLNKRLHRLVAFSLSTEMQSTEPQARETC